VSTWATVLLSLLSGLGSYVASSNSAATNNALTADHVRQLEAWREKHDAEATDLERKVADLAAQQKVDEAEVTAILEGIHRMEEKLDQLADQRRAR